MLKRQEMLYKFNAPSTRKEKAKQKSQIRTRALCTNNGTCWHEVNKGEEKAVKVKESFCIFFVEFPG